MSNTLGEFLTELRNQKHWSITEAANELKIHRAYLWLLENGRRKKPRPEIIKKLALGYGVSVEKFLGYLGYFTNANEDKRINKQQEEEKITRIFSVIREDKSFEFGTRLKGKN